MTVAFTFDRQNLISSPLWGQVNICSKSHEFPLGCSWDTENTKDEHEVTVTFNFDLWASKFYNFAPEAVEV